MQAPLVCLLTLPRSEGYSFGDIVANLKYPLNWGRFTPTPFTTSRITCKLYFHMRVYVR